MVRNAVFALCFSFSMANAQNVGDVIPNMAYAGGIFAEACVKTMPRFRRAGRVLEANGFVQAPTGTYYHPHYSMSVKPIINQRRSIVAEYTDSEQSAVNRFRKAATDRAPAAAEIEVESRSGMGHTFLRSVARR